jgi:formamidopyrimidine-DNA glycosylase
VRDAPRKESILNREILGAEIYWHKTVAAGEPGFAARLRGQSVRVVSRRAKFLVIQLSADFLIIHLRMSGDIALRPAGSPVQKHDRVIWQFSGGLDMAFNDTRKFGRVWLLDDPAPLFAGLGPEPLGEAFTAGWLHGALAQRSRAIKPLLLDQAFLAGVGNIYADESLHRAGIHPLRIASSLSETEAARLHAHIRAVLEEGIAKNGASIDWVYRGGEFQHAFRVYGRAGEPCYNCGTPVERMVVGQRGTHFCPNCQPARTG